MSVGDFVRGLHHDLRSDEPLTDTLLDAVSEAAAGGTARLWWLGVQLRGGVMQSAYAGAECRFIADSVMAVRRGDSLLDERPVAEWLFAGDCSDALFWDVGGYHGHYASIAAQQGCRLRVFEPAAENRRRIVENLELNGVGYGHERVTVDGRALSDQTGERPFGGASLSELSVGGGEGKYLETPAQQTTQTVPGDDIGELPDRVKIDVEGHEHRVLSGMSETLAYVDRIVVEVHGGEPDGTIEGVLADAGLETRTIPCRRSQTYVGGWRE